MAASNEWDIVGDEGSEWDVVETPAAPKAPIAVQETPRGFYDLFKDNYSQASQEGFAGWLARRAMTATEMGLPEKFQDLPEDERSELYKSSLTEAARRTRQQLADKDAADPTWRSDLSWDRNIDRSAAMLVGQILGGADPTYLIGGPTAMQGLKGVAARIGTQTGLAGIVDAFLQKADISEGIEDEFDPQRLGLNMLAGAGFQGMFEGARGLAKLGKVEVDETGRPFVKTQEADGTYTYTYEVPEEGGLTATVTDEKPWVEATPEGGDLEAKLATEANAFLRRGEDVPTAAELPRMSVDEGVNLINETTKDWTNAPEFEVHETFADLPDVDPDAVGAVMPDGKVVINMQNVAAEAAFRGVEPQDIVKAVTFHEALGHHGLTQRFRDDLDGVLETLYDKGDSKFRERVDNWVTANPDAYADEANPFARQIEEVFAEMSEKGQITRSMMDQIKDYLKNFARNLGIDLKYSDREIRSILGMAHSAVTNGSGADVPSNGFRYMYVGDNSQTLDPQARAAFMQGEGGGADPVDLLQETGIFRGPEGSIRTEIRDDIAELKDYDGDTVFDILPQGGSTNLQDTINHTELFKAYPFLRDVIVQSEPAPGDISQRQRGSFFMTDNGEYVINVTPYNDDKLSTILHEVQHAIQEYEGWARGGNESSVIRSLSPTQFKKFRQELVTELEGQYEYAFDEAEYLRKIDADPKLRSLADRLREQHFEAQRLRDAGDTEAWSEAYRREGDLRLALLKATTPYDSFLQADAETTGHFYTLEAALQRRGEDPLGSAIAGAKRELDQAYDGLQQVAESTDRKFISHMAKNTRTAFRHYQNIFGEIEARDVQARQALNDFERGGYLPYSSANDVAAEDIIINRRGFSTEEGPAEDLGTRYMRRSRPTAGEGSEGQLQGRSIREGARGRPEAVAKFRSDRQIEDILKEAAPEGTPESWEDWLYDAGKMKMTAKMASELDKGTDPATLKAAEIVALRSANRIKDLQTKIINGTATMRDRELFNREIQRLDTISESIMNVVSNAGRILNSRNIEVAEDRALIDGIRKMVTSNPQLLQTPEGAEQVARMLDKGQRAAKFKAEALRITGNILNLPRSIMSSMDLSAPLRQGIFLVGRKEFWKNILPMFKMLGDDAFRAAEAEILSRPTHRLMERAGLGLAEFGSNLSNREEDFMSQWIDKVPGIAHSSRAYTGFLNKLRADTFDSLVKQYNEAGIDLSKAENAKALKDIAKYVNNATGRGELGSFTQSAKVLSNVFFSPRLIASRVRMLNPMTYIQLDPIVRKEALKSLVSFGSIATTVASLAAMGGADVETDPRSSDFAKIKVGNTRYDILGGFGQYLTLGARLATNEKKTLKGEVQELGKKYGSDTRKDVVLDFFANKASPLAGFVRDYLEGKDPTGAPFDMQQSIASMFVPMFIQDASELIEDRGFEEGLPMTAPGIFGVGISTFEPRTSKSDSKKSEPSTTSTNEWEIVE